VLKLKLFSPSFYSLLLTALIALASGFLMGLAPAPFNAWVLAWIAIAPLWIMIRSAIANGRQSFLVCLLPAAFWGIGYHGLALSWILDLHPLTWMGIPWLGSVAIALFAWFFITFWGAALVVSWGLGTIGICYLLTHLRARYVTTSTQSDTVSTLSISAARLPSWFYILVGTTVWCGLEELWSFGALYWSSISYTQSPANLVILHLGQISGPMTVTAAIVAVNGCLAEAWLHFRQRQSAAAKQLFITSLALLIGFHLIGYVLYVQPIARSPETALKIGIIQGNIPTRIKLFDEGIRRSLVSYTSGYRALADQQVDAVLMSEGALPWVWVNTTKQAQNPLYQAILQRGVPAWVGTVGVKQGRITQSLFSIAGTGEITGRYDKVKLVPLGEYVPFEAIVGRLIGRLSPVEASMVPGDFEQQFDTPFGKAIAGICYESAFAQLFRNQAAAGGEFIVTASNNDPYDRGMMEQHHAQDVMRAIETDRWAARATNTGLSGIVDPHGRTIWLSGFRTYETHVDTLYQRQTRTLYVQLGNWLMPTLFIAVFLSGMSILLQKRA
jgi:apolipoprotein N-acyltransferase